MGMGWPVSSDKWKVPFQCISSILEQKLEYLNKTQLSIKFCFLGNNYQRKVGDVFM